MIPQQQFGRTTHSSTRVIFGSYALSRATQDEADRTLSVLLEYGINHIDTAPMYGNAEQCIGPWMAQYRDQFFLATKSRSRTYKGAWKDLRRSLARLRVDSVDLWQLHGLTNPVGWENAMGPEGALKAFMEARDQGLVRYLGVTGHGDKAPAMHKRSLERFDFDTVLLPYNYLLMENSHYATDFHELMELCRARNVAVQTMKSIARVPCEGRSKTYNTYFYEPLEAQEAIDKSVHWSLGLQDSFLITAGDMQLLPKVLDAATRFEKRPSTGAMRALVEEGRMQQIFPSAAQRRAQGKGPQTWGGQACQALEALLREDFFKSPNRRTREHVIKALESKGLSTTGEEQKITSLLARRVRKGVLQKSKVSTGWIYWTD